MLKLLHEFCSLPTAPFVEDRVVAYVERFVEQRRKLRLSRDPQGNLLVELPGTKRDLPRWVFGAHMDHPGLVTRGMVDRKTVECDFRGWVLKPFLEHTRVIFFDGDREIPGKVIDVEADRADRSRVVRVAVREPVASNVAGMFDQGEARVKGKRFLSRSIDDLAGGAAALAMIDALHGSPPPSTVCVLLTRAEEEGFVGAMAAALRPKLLRKKTDRIIAIETSAMQPHAPQGKGPIIRLGDRTSIFNSSLSYFMTQQADALKKRKRSFQYQRAVMPGGTCEATVYDVYGFHAGSICIALGNYHNMDKEKGKIGPEYIDLNDWKGMVDLFLRIARNGHEYVEGHAALKERLEKRYNDLSHLLVR